MQRTLRSPTAIRAVPSPLCRPIRAFFWRLFRRRPGYAPWAGRQAFPQLLLLSTTRTVGAAPPRGDSAVQLGLVDAVRRPAGCETQRRERLWRGGLGGGKGGAGGLFFSPGARNSGGGAAGRFFLHPPKLPRTVTLFLS